MTMIPPAPSAPSYQQTVREQYQQIPASGKAFGGFSPGAPLSAPDSSFPQGGPAPTQLSSEQQHKLSIARGDGLRTTPKLAASSGDTIYLQNINGEFMPCRRCGIRPCSGIRWLFDGEIRFKCNICGKHMKLGYTAETARENQTSLQGWDRAEQNRRRLWREGDAAREEEMQRDFDEISRSNNPYFSATKDTGFVMSQFFQ